MGKTQSQSCHQYIGAISFLNVLICVLWQLCKPVNIFLKIFIHILQYGLFYNLSPFTVIYLNSYKNTLPKVNFNCCRLKIFQDLQCTIHCCKLHYMRHNITFSSRKIPQSFQSKKGHHSKPVLVAKLKIYLNETVNNHFSF